MNKDINTFIAVSTLALLRKDNIEKEAGWGSEILKRTGKGLATPIKGGFNWLTGKSIRPALKDLAKSRQTLKNALKPKIGKTPLSLGEISDLNKDILKKNLKSKLMKIGPYASIGVPGAAAVSMVSNKLTSKGKDTGTSLESLISENPALAVGGGLGTLALLALLLRK